jgi:thiamine pyrophosphokinase
MATSPTRVVVIAGGEIHTTPTIESDDLVIAADSGYDHALSLGIQVDLLIGDLDSISPTGLDHARAHRVETLEFPKDKENTDLELALRAALDRGATTVAIHGGEGGTIAHLLGVALSIIHRDWEEIDVVWHTGTGIIRPATRNRSIEASVEIGDTITIIPVGDVRGVTTSGLRWPLENASMEHGTTLGISNEATATTVTVTVDEGALLVIQEHGSPR